MDWLGELRRLERSLNARFVEREEVVRGLLLALGVREHVLVVGPPGTAKSELVRTFASFVGLRVFQKLLTKTTTDAEVLGPFDIRAMEEGRFERVIAGTLLDAEVVFVDEVFKASSAILNALLEAVNERTFTNGTRILRLPLEVMIGASNELPEGDEEAALTAFADRFLLRYRVEYVRERSAFLSVLLSVLRDSEEELEPLAPEALRAYREAVGRVAVGDEVFEAIADLRDRLAEEGVVVSDRRWRKTLPVLRAHAALSGDDRVDLARDGEVLPHMLWGRPEELRVVRKVCMRALDPVGLKLTELLEDAKAVYETAMAEAKKPDANLAAVGQEANKKLKMAARELEALAKEAGVSGRERFAKALAEVQAWNREVMKECLGIDLAVV